MTTSVSVLDSSAGIGDPGRVSDGGAQRPDPEVPERARRRTFTAQYKVEILAAYDAGIVLQELYFLECLAQVRQAESVFVIGNSFGWSTLALSLLHPGATVTAIDSGFDENSLEGMDLTNRIAVGLGTGATAIRATSPQDVRAVVFSNLGGAVDLAFIDGFHTHGSDRR
jgi:predicted O-methyltransferase YrrM